MTSETAARDLMRATPAGDLRSTTSEDLCRVSWSGTCRATGPETARSMRRTEAPASERRRPAKGPVLALVLGHSQVMVMSK